MYGWLNRIADAEASKTFYFYDRDDAVDPKKWILAEQYVRYGSYPNSPELVRLTRQFVHHVMNNDFIACREIYHKIMNPARLVIGLCVDNIPKGKETICDFCMKKEYFR